MRALAVGFPPSSQHALPRPRGLLPEQHRELRREAIGNAGIECAMRIDQITQRIVVGRRQRTEGPVAQPLFEQAQREVARERQMAVDLGRKIFGDRVTDWKSLGDVIRADPQEKFASAEAVREFTQRTYERAAAAADRMELTPPAGKVVLEPFPELQQATAPGGQYLPAAEDGSRPATYH